MRFNALENRSKGIASKVVSLSNEDLRNANFGANDPDFCIEDYNDQQRKKTFAQTGIRLSSRFYADLIRLSGRSLVDEKYRGDMET